MKNAFGGEVELIEGRGGVFQVTVDGKLIFNKSESGRFPKPGEITGLIRGG